MNRTMSWDWETFPEWLEHLRTLPKGLNVATYLPMNPLLCYVVGPDEAKNRPATEVERAEMRRLMHEAMDTGASGFAFSFLGGEGNSHVDYDQTPMPTDIMAKDEAYNLAAVLRERNEGIIQLLCELPGMSREQRGFCEELARRSGRPVLHNATVAREEDPEQHLSLMSWLDDCNAKGLKMYAQGFTFRKPLEIHPLYYNNWDSLPPFRALSAAHTVEEKVALVKAKDYRDWFERDYDPVAMGGERSLNFYILVDAGESPSFKRFEGQEIRAIAAELGRSIPTTFLDILEETQMEVLFISTVYTSADTIAEFLRNRYVLAGLSDGGAHSKHGNGGFWSTDLIMLMTRETNTMTSEEVHNLLSARNAEAGGIRDRGALILGNYADVMIYDAATLNYDPPLRYHQLHDLPGGDWRKVKKALGVRYVLVNGVVTFIDGEDTGATPGMLVADQTRADDASAHGVDVARNRHPATLPKRALS
jgi:N-acyl-D-amino-acid deacylase